MRDKECQFRRGTSWCPDDGSPAPPARAAPPGRRRAGTDIGAAAGAPVIRKIDTGHSMQNQPAQTSDRAAPGAEGGGGRSVLRPSPGRPAAGPIERPSRAGSRGGASRLGGGGNATECAPPAPRRPNNPRGAGFGRGRGARGAGLRPPCAPANPAGAQTKTTGVWAAIGGFVVRAQIASPTGISQRRGSLGSSDLVPARHGADVLSLRARGPEGPSQGGRAAGPPAGRRR